MSRRKKPPSLEELLCETSCSNLELLSNLQQWKQQADSDDSGNFKNRLLVTEAAREALAGRIIQGCQDCKAFAAAEDASAQAELLEEHLLVLSQLAMLMPEEPEDKLARVLMHGSELPQAFEALISCIHTLCQQCSAWPCSPELDSLLLSLGQAGREVLAVIQDMACYRFTAQHISLTQMGGTQSKGSMQTFGREQCGAVLLGAIMDLAAMDISMSRRFYALRRSAVSCVVAICSFSRRNQINLIGKHEDAYNTLMRQILPACGDVHTQVDLFEIMYRVGKTFTERAYSKHMNAQLRGKFAELLAMDTAQLGDLWERLHGLVVDYNSSLNNPSVHHVHAEDVQVLSPLEKALRPLGREVALGVGHLSLQVEVDDQNATYPETCDIQYTNMTRVVVQPMGRPDGAVQLQADFLCKPFPPALGTVVEQRARQMADGKNPWFKLGLLLEREEANKLMRVLHTQDVTVVNQSNNLAEPSQPEVKLHKVSMGNLPTSYKPKLPLALTKTTPATDNKMKPLTLFPTPQTAAAATAAGANRGAAAGADADAKPHDGAADRQLQSTDSGDGVAEEQQPSPEFGAAAAPVAATGALETDLAAATPVPEGTGAYVNSAREEEMLQALLQTVEEMPSKHTGSRPTLSGSLMAGPSPEPAAGPLMVPATAATMTKAAKGGDRADYKAAGAGKETAPAAAVAAADTKQQQQQQGRKQAAGRGKQQQQEGKQKVVGADSVSWNADEAAGGQQDDEDVQQDNNLQSNSQDPALEASPAAAAKTRRRGKTMALAGPAAAAPDNKGVRKNAAKQAAANTAKPEAAPAAHLPAGTSKPPAGRGRKAADRKAPAGGLFLDRPSERQQAKETQDPIQDPDLPSLPPSARKAPSTAAACEQPATDMPAWLNNTSTAAGRGAAASAPVNKVTTPYSSRIARPAAHTAVAGAVAVGAGVPAVSPGSGGKRKAGRLDKLGATPQGKGRGPAAAAAARNQGQRAAPAEDAAAGDQYAFPDDDAAEAAAEDAVHDAFPDTTAAAGGAKGQKGRQAAAKGGGASGRGCKAAAAAADTAAAGGQQQEPLLSDFHFPVSDDTNAEDDNVARNDDRAGRVVKGGRGAKGRGRGRGRGGAAAAKVGAKRKAAAAGGAAGNRQKQQRKGAAAAEAAADAVGDREDGDVVNGTVDDDTMPASDLLDLRLDSQPDADAADAAAAAAAAGKKQRQQKQQLQGGKEQAASLSPGAARRQPRASKSKALEAMQQQQRVLNQPTQADLQDEYGFGDLQIHPADQENEEDGAADGGDMFRAEAGGWGGLAAVPHSPGAQSGSGGSKGAASDSSDDDDMAQLQTLLQGGLKPTTQSRQLARLLQRGQPPAVAAGTPESQKIHTAQVARKLALTGAVTKGDANKRRQAAAAAATTAVLEPPLNGGTAAAAAAAGKRKAGAAAHDSFKLPGLGADDLSPNAPDVDAAGANDMAAGFNLDLTSRRQPGKGGGGLKGLGLRPAAAAAAAAAADDDDSDDEEAAATRFGSLAANCRKPQRHGAFAATGVVFREEDAAGSGGGLEGSERNAAEVAHLMAKAFADDDDDDDSNSDDDERTMVENLLLATYKMKKQADARRQQQALKDLVASLEEQIAEIEAEMKKDFSTLASRGKIQTEKMLAQLEAQAAQLQAIYERAQQELREQWEGYRGLYEKACNMQQSLRAAAERGRTVYKRKVADMQQAALVQFQALDRASVAKRARTDAHFRQMAIMLKAAQ